ncbi:MAG: bifunctional molybdenum cofactor biosynthesis protein MoaC/MoaB [Candidatus Obscuribacter sp.]|jgi:cyclic pyranopterin phosphate synthase|nr:bifunctional molybdenum cofactor biosynthesis protein MoaC/MoaB [Candidatus Obscuribacter sp.]MBK7838672.1 bifunctional molybdenum cofactor biosynthesis protein MoaC/MoaB [Candidatus Obscuribacter sp.]MBK9621207.1 bifunctional molybdenum cofactor biosynthesis protein MoaC/MoaB [Candidatus Obscuribacter sp.]
MRDISQKVSTLRTAVAKAIIRVSPSTIEQIRNNTLPKGNPLDVARVAAVQAAKNTSLIIPYCHPLPVDFVGIEFHMDEDAIEIETTVKAIYKTGVEMEALTAATVAALTIYDMAKMVDDLMQIESILLVSKTGGKSDFALTDPAGKPLKAAVLVLSDSVAKGKNKDLSGKHLVEFLESENFEISEYTILPDDESEIVPAVRRICDELKVDLLITTGGTGISPRDNTPEALNRLIELELPGIAEAIRTYGQERNIHSMLSRGVSGVRQKTIIVSLPGSTSAVEDGLKVLFPAIRHAFKMLEGHGHHGHHGKQLSRPSGEIIRGSLT